jgi:hypothetical protein
MNCCGKKRQALTSSFSDPPKTINESQGEDSTVSVESNGSRTTALFRYTGRSSLEVDGIFRHRVYKFSKGIPELVIMAEDVAVMRGYPELIELKDER